MIIPNVYNIEQGNKDEGEKTIKYRSQFKKVYNCVDYKGTILNLSSLPEYRSGGL